MASPPGTLSTGVTNDIQRGTIEHKNQVGSGFTAKYNVTPWFISNRAAAVWMRLSATKKLRAGGERKSAP